MKIPDSLKSRAWELRTILQEEWDRFRSLDAKRKAIVWGAVASVIVLAVANPSLEGYKEEMGGFLYEKFEGANIKTKFFNKVLFDSVAESARQNAVRYNFLVFSVFSTEVSLYGPGTPDLTTSSVGVLGVKFVTDFKVTEPMAEALRPHRAKGR